MSRQSHRWKRCARPMAVAAAAACAAALVPGGAGAGEDFIAGSGRARASLFEVVPRTGGLTIPVNFGRALASYQGTLAEASSIAVKPPSQPAAECGDDNPGGGAPGGGGSRPGFAFPFSSNLAVRSDEDKSEAGKEASMASMPADSPVRGSLQHQVVTARDDPFGEAATTSGHLALADVIELTGGRAEARSGVVEGRTRLAEAVVTFSRLTFLQGAVVLEDLRWEASQRTGDGEAMDGGFSVGRVVMSGTPLAPPPPGADPLAELNAALAPTGLAVDAPRLEKANGTARVTPLSVRMADSPTGREVVGPLLAGLQPVRDPMVDVLLGFSCDFGRALTVADVALGVASGSGGVSLDIGGVTATTEGTRFDNPFAGPIDDAFPGVEAGPPAEEPPSDGPVGGDLPSSPGTTVPSFDPGAAPAHDGGGYGTDTLYGPVGEPAADTGDAMAAPASAGFEPDGGVVSRRLPGRRGGTALAIGILGLGAVLAVAGADALRIRRAARSFP